MLTSPKVLAGSGVVGAGGVRDVSDPDVHRDCHEAFEGSQDCVRDWSHRATPLDDHVDLEDVFPEPDACEAATREVGGGFPERTRVEPRHTRNG
jgi:hypothetical protein